MSTVTRIISWNMNQRPDNWLVLTEMIHEQNAVAAAVQEAVTPPESLRGQLQIVGDPSLGNDTWRIPVPTNTKRRFASALAFRTGVSLEFYSPKPLTEAGYGEPTISHQGQWVAGAITDSGDKTWIISMYGIWDRMADTGDIFAEATLHRAISDLTPLFQAQDTKRLVLAGDLNIWRGYGSEKWKPRYETVFQRLKAYDVSFAGPRRTDGEPLAGCPCKRGGGCDHVRTYRHQHRAESTPYQTDYIFTRGVRVEQCRVLDEERYWRASDHCPLIVEIRDASGLGTNQIPRITPD